jgi:hypothetical protein
MPRRDLVPGGAPSRLAALLREETRSRGRAMQMHELREALPDDLATVRTNLPSMLNALVRRGVVEVVTGRRGRRQYRHRDLSVPAFPDQDFALDIYRVLVDEVARLGRPVTCFEVTQACKREGIALRNAEPGMYLIALCRKTFVAGPGHRPGPLVARHRKTTLAGKTTHLYAPVNAVFRDMSWAASDTPPVHHAIECVRQAVAEVERQLGRPVQRAEIMFWRRFHLDSSPVARALEPRIGDHLKHLQLEASWKRSRGAIAIPEGRRVQRFRTALTGAGAAQAWYHALALGTEGLDDALHVCALEDTCLYYRVASEAEELRALRTAWASMRLGDGASQRERALALRDQALRAVLCEAVPAARREAVLARYTHTVDVRDAWRQGPLTDHERRTRGLAPQAYLWAQRLQDLRASIPVVADVYRDGGAGSEGEGRPLAVVGAAGVVSSPVVLPLAICAAEAAGEHGEQAARKILQGGRRAPGGGQMLYGADMTRRPVYEEVQMDRVDAVVLCVSAVGAPRTSALVQGGKSMVGHILRDAAALHDLLRTEEAPEVRRWLLIGLALLGEEPPLDLVRSRGLDPETAAALIVATALARPSQAASAIEAIQASVAPAYDEMFDVAMSRARAGNLLSLVD